MFPIQRFFHSVNRQSHSPPHFGAYVPVKKVTPRLGDPSKPYWNLVMLLSHVRGEGAEQEVLKTPINELLEKHPEIKTVQDLLSVEIIPRIHPFPFSIQEWLTIADSFIKTTAMSWHHVLKADNTLLETVEFATPKKAYGSTDGDFLDFVGKQAVKQVQSDIMTKDHPHSVLLTSTRNFDRQATVYGIATGEHIAQVKSLRKQGKTDLEIADKLSETPLNAGRIEKTSSGYVFNPNET